LDPASNAFDVVFMGHTLEHISEQHETLRQLERLLAPGGVAIVRIPMIPCYAWEHYETDWVQLDAPRHFVIHTPESLRLLAEDAGLRIDEIEYDSNSFQFWGSEQYRMGIPLSAANSWSVSPRRSPFDPAKIDEFEERATQLNRERRGDQVAVWLRPDRSVGAP
jgi:SAM-dependent methyltransferase